MIIIVVAAIIINTKTNIKLREQPEMSDKNSIIITTYKLIWRKPTSLVESIN